MFAIIIAVLKGFGAVSVYAILISIACVTFMAIAKACDQSAAYAAKAERDEHLRLLFGPIEGLRQRMYDTNQRGYNAETTREYNSREAFDRGDFKRCDPAMLSLLNNKRLRRRADRLQREFEARVKNLRNYTRPSYRAWWGGFRATRGS